MMNKFKQLINYMRGTKSLYVLSIAAIAVATVFWLLQPLVYRLTVDSLIGGSAIEAAPWLMRLIESIGGRTVLAKNLWISGLALVGLTIIRGGFLYLKGTWSAIAAETTARRIRDALYKHIHKLPYEYHVKVATGDLIQRCTSDVETIRKFLASQLVEIGRALFLVSFTAIMMFTINTKLAFISFCAIPGIFAFSFFFFKRVRTAFQLSDESEGRLSNVLQENLTGTRVVRAFARQDFEVGKFETKNAEYRTLTRRVVRLMAWYWSVSDLVSLLQIAAVLIAGAVLAVRGQITLGTLLVFINYIGRLLWPVRQMGRILTEMGKTSVALGRIQQIFDEEPEPMLEEGITSPISGNVEFKSVGFSYDGGKAVLSDITFSAKAGETVAILGPTGSGKSTLMYLLSRLYDCTDGSITLDGRNIEEFNKKWLRRQVGMVLQEPFLYSRSILDNIGLTQDEPNKEQVETVANIASFHESILEFEKGYQTVLGEEGVTLSGGQRQRVAIARTLLIESPILILDDSLSAVDTETDSAIRRSLKEREGKVTTFIIAHRLTTLSEADKIIVIDGGRLVQIGTHAELISKAGLYKRIWEIQNDLEAELDAEMDNEKTPPRQYA